MIKPNCKPQNCKARVPAGDPCLAIRTLAIAALLGAGAVYGPKPVAAAPTPKATSGSPATVEEMYPVGVLRNPFLRVEGSGGPKVPDGATLGLVPSEEFSIHTLELKGVMDDRTGGFAILVEPKFGASFVLKRGRLFDLRNKPVPGVTGTVKAKQKIVELIAIRSERSSLPRHEFAPDGREIVTSAQTSFARYNDREKRSLIMGEKDDKEKKDDASNASTAPSAKVNQ